MLSVPNQLRANLNAWKDNPNTARRLPATVLPPWGPPSRELDQVQKAKERDNNPALDLDPREGVIVDSKTGDTVTLSEFQGKNYFEEVKADGDVTAMLYNRQGLHKVSYYQAQGESHYSATQKFVPMNSNEGWHALREVE